MIHDTSGNRGDDDESDWRDALRELVTHPATYPLPPVAEFARRARQLVPQVASGVVDRVAEYVGFFAERETDRHQMLTEGVAAAMHEFLDLFDGMPHRDRDAVALFRKLGQRHAAEHEDMSGLYAAFHVATSQVTTILTEAGGPALDDDEAVGRLAQVGHRYVERLTRETAAGFRAVRRHMDLSIGLARRRQVEQLLSGRNLTHETGLPSWSVPDQVIVVVAEMADHSRVDPGELGLDCLFLESGPYLVAVAAAPDAIPLVDALSRQPSARIAFSWAVEPEQVPAAHRWARRALALVRRGVIPEQAVIDCGAHRTQIWLHAEPVLRQWMCQELLAPLLAETPNSREILSETLLAWLESRDSAPAIAARLGVHPQTVRYRWKRINELFGEDLHEPEFVVQVTMLLKASVPLWKAGDQSDFERFRSGVTS